jgi:ABC-type transporter Mla subunit MlaD
MTQEELERKMEFLLKQQESFSDTLQDVVNTLHEIGERQDKLAERQDKFQEQQERTDKAVIGLMAIVADVIQAQRATDTRIKEASERLDVFINVLERYISENRNGGHGKES